MVVYADVVFLINLVMDYAVLWAASRIGQFKTSIARLVLAAGFGAGYAVATLFALPPGLTGLAARVLVSVFMAGIAFGRLPAGRFVQAVAYLYVVAFAMGGAMLGGMYLVGGTAGIPVVTGSVSLWAQVEYPWLLAAVATAFILGRWITRALRKSLFRSILKLPVILKFGDVHLPVEALIDTGNQLRDPLSQRPVMVIEYGVLKPLLPESVGPLFERGEDPDVDMVISGLAGTVWSARVRMIPFTSIGRSKGMLIAFRADEVIVAKDDRPIKLKDVAVAVYNKPLSPEGSYRALLHPEMINELMGA